MTPWPCFYSILSPILHSTLPFPRYVISFRLAEGPVVLFLSGDCLWLLHQPLRFARVWGYLEHAQSGILALS
ncbi:hypothetical protein K432DRAFT_57468 [Lepidopterella palustris CBS 459.81]|uniref:Uncharacterized protein n=1 Tax=Lepidopterella palustris CBS 459.81 TaxID=1314670 RepID=A0A8E2E9U5_9PEZI|nr:hypothetical protein K432DRAFT_57468 [Lepidopterella palustris CBS 459.81]